ncbi:MULTISPECIES: ISAzo13 family transposase [Protofrankia]|uniref:Rhodopirellula transposase family protein n=1 Tax=Candidatus Protofrankia datiscae TaxID=2716812 RepID=F8B4Q3_9ACTN|nr:MULTISPECIES: ISAzo13 family transposase [Protofrankia]AEH09105.1 Rhodopirellula transposase family protein [Candidatus Protofrankia datiscae]
MAITENVLDQMSRRFAVVLPHLDERQRRLVLATEARLLGHGGVRAVARVAGVSETTVRTGVFELEAGEQPLSGRRVRRPGGGRKRIEDTDPAVVAALLALVEPDERGDPMSPLRWTTKSLRHLAEKLTRQGHPVSPSTVRRLLRAAGFSLQANSKTLEGKQHPDRDTQFRYLNEQVIEHRKAGEPVISVDTKKEMLGQLPNPGREWRPKGDPVQVEDHSFFTGPQGETAIPYGVYDLTADAGWVNVGVDHDTSAFAVASIRRWWQARGQADYPRATRLLVTADAGGSNSYRYRSWKAELATLAADTGLAITVCHFPPGTSKWNKIEHRLFSQITMNWRGRPLTSHEVVVNTITATRTRSGLRVEAHLDTQNYPVGVAVSKARIDTLPITSHPVRGKWNYTVHPARSDGAVDSSGAVDTAVVPDRAATLVLLAHPRLTGMSTAEMDTLAAQLAPAQAARREQRRYQQRGGPRRHAPGAHGRTLLSPRDRVLVTVVHLRQICSQRVLADMLEVNPRTIGEAVTDVRQLLHEQNITIEPTTLRFTQAEQITAYAHSGQYDDGRPSLPWALSDPALTGMSRADLAALVEQVSVRQAAAVERRRHQQRGRQRLPGTRAGVFPQKITSGERVLAAVLHHRKVATGRVLADLFGVSHRTIGTAFLDVRPILDEDGIHLPPAPVKFRTTEQLLASLTPADETATPTG